MRTRRAILHMDEWRRRVLIVQFKRAEEGEGQGQGGVGSVTRRGDKPLRKCLGDRAAKSFASVGPLHEITSSTLTSPLAVGGSESRRWSGEVGAKVLASAASEP